MYTYSCKWYELLVGLAGYLIVLQKGQILGNLVSFYHTIDYWLYYFISDTANENMLEMMR